MRDRQRWSLGLVLLLVLPSEGLNALGMWRVKSRLVASNIEQSLDVLALWHDDSRDS